MVLPHLPPLNPPQPQMRPPTPLPLHLALALLSSMSLPVGLSNWNTGWLGSRPNLPPETSPDAVANMATGMATGMAHAQQYRAQFHSTLNACQTATRPHPLPPPARIWHEGSTKILDYGPFCPDSAAARPVLVIPSLVNRAYILDLSAERSFLRYLCQHGFRPLLVDWDVPGPVERSFDVGDYIGRLRRALAALAVTAHGITMPLPVIGYCMGGLLATALAVIEPEAVQRLVLLATPWDFHAATSAGQRVHLAQLWPYLDGLLQQQGALPVTVLQALLTTLDPFAVVNRYIYFAIHRSAVPDNEQQHFFALEDWLADGVSLSAPVAREALLGWYQENQPMRGEWRMTVRTSPCNSPEQHVLIHPTHLQCPLMIVTPQRDRIVPPLSALALGAGVADVSLLQPRTGHIGMVAGRKAETEMWQGVARWLR